MEKTLKNNYIELSKKFGGTHALISKGIKKGIVNSIMRGSIPKANELYKVAKILGVTVEELLTGEHKESMHKKVAPFYGYTKEEKEYIDKLIELFRTKDEDTKKAIMQNIDTFLRVPPAGKFKKTAYGKRG